MVAAGGEQIVVALASIRISCLAHETSEVSDVRATPTGAARSSLTPGLGSPPGARDSEVAELGQRQLQHFFPLSAFPMPPAAFACVFLPVGLLHQKQSRCNGHVWLAITSQFQKK